MAQIDKPNLHFNTVLYTGDGATSTAGTLARTISGVGFQPDFTWVKGRTSGGYDSHGLHDAVRTAPKWLRSDGTDQEYDVRTGFGSGGVGSFTSDGFGLFSGTSGNANNYNTSSTTYVAWNWKASGSTTTNSNGSVSCSQSLNATAGFSIFKWTGTGSGEVSIGHGLGTAPKMWFVKSLSSGQWFVYTTVIDGSLDYLHLHDTSAKANSSATAPTNSVIYGVSNTNQAEDYICYAFKEVQGYSKFGSYTANGNADGTFVYTGFAPKFIIFKRTDTSGYNWVMMDDKRNTYNPWTNLLLPNEPNAEIGLPTNLSTDFLSNGFKLRSASGANPSTNQGTIVYMAFGQSLVGSNNVPSTAR